MHAIRTIIIVHIDLNHVHKKTGCFDHFLGIEKLNLHAHFDGRITIMSFLRVPSSCLIGN